MTDETDDNDPFDTQNDPSPDDSSTQDDGSSPVQDNTDWSSTNQPFGDLQRGPNPRLGLPQDFSPQPDPKKIMSYLHGSDGLPKHVVDAAIDQAEIDATNQFAKDNSSGPTYKDDQDPLDTQNDPSGPRQQKPIPPTQTVTSDPFNTSVANETSTPPAATDSTEQTLIDHANVGGDDKEYDNSTVGKPKKVDNKYLNRNVPPTETGEYYDNVGKSNRPPTLGPDDSGALPVAEPDKKPDDDSGALPAVGPEDKKDTPAMKAIANALEQHGEKYAHHLMQGMKQAYNAIRAYGAAALRNGDTAKAADAANKSSRYLPMPDTATYLSNDKGGLTVHTTNNQGQVVKHDLDPNEAHGILDPAGGAQWDRMIHKGHDQAAQDVKQQNQANPFNTPQPYRPGVNGPQQPPTPGPGQPFKGTPQARAQQQDNDDDESPLGIPASARTGPVRSGRAPESGYYDDNMGYHKTQNARNVTYQQDRPDNTDPSAVTMYNRNGTFNGQGEQIGSNDPRTLRNRDATEKMKLEQTKADNAYDKAVDVEKMKVKVAGDAIAQKDKAAGRRSDDYNHRTDTQATTAAGNTQVQKDHFNQLDRQRAQEARDKYERNLIQQGTKPPDARKLTDKYFPGTQSSIGMQPSMQAAPQAPQPQAPTGGIQPGFVKNGWVYKGGDPSQQANWARQ